MHIPFVDLKKQYNSLKAAIQPEMERLMEECHYILGKDVKTFEENFASYCGAKECIGTASGTDALLWALKALDTGPGDEVITPANTFIATVLAITYAGATPVLVDCDEETYNLNIQEVKEKINERTKAVIPVHLYGLPVEMDKLMNMAKEHGVYIIEDAAQAHGATYENFRCGSIGDIGCFSFFPSKNLGAFGDGGAVVTNNEEIAENIRMIRNYGQKEKYHHRITGWNSRLDTIQAGILNIKLSYLDQWNQARRKHAETYRTHLKELPIQLPPEMAECSHVYHLFVIRVKNRDKVMNHLKAKGIECGIHYPVPVHLQPAYVDLDLWEGSFPKAEKLAKEILSLPMFPELTDEQIEYVCASLKEAVEQD